MTALLFLGFVEIVSGLTTLVLIQRGWMAYIQNPSPEEVARNLLSHDPILGWGAKTDSSGKAIHSIPQQDPILAFDQAPCVSVYGDSFTFGGDSRSKTYSHYLALELGCPVANFGVLGYGSDQALMLFQAQIDWDRSPFVVLAHVTENILRNVNQYRNLLYPGGKELAFKPRFAVDGNSLRTIPIPVKNLEDFHGLQNNPAAWLPFDAFVDRPRRSFPYSIALFRWLMKDYHVRAKILGYPRYASYYSPDHSSGALELTRLILATFSIESLAHGKTPLILIIPTGEDLVYAKKTGTWVEQPLVESLRREGYVLIDAGPEMLPLLGDKDPCRLYEVCNGHLNAEGHEMLAGIIAQEIKKLSKS